MKLNLVSKKIENPSIVIKVVTVNPEALEKEKNETGEWEYNSKTSTLLSAIRNDASDIDLRKFMLSFSSQTHGKWGAKPFIDLSDFELNVKPVLKSILLSTYDLGIFKTSKSKPKQETLAVLCDQLDEKNLREIEIEADVQKRVMHLVDLPPNHLTPEEFGHWARESAKNFGFDCEVWNEEHIISESLHALHAVGRGSQHESVFIISSYNGAPSRKEVDLAVVGKGITFDTGGISIKDSSNMHYMKSDMGGGAAALGTIELAARLKLPINIVAVVPSAENAVNGNSLLPGEVINTYSGKTVEVINTDAEGRLILADGLAWVIKNKKPSTVVDMATLTGSAVRALGFEAAALFTNNETLAESLEKAGLETGEKLWRLPLWKDYNSYISSEIADVSNLPLKPVAGAIAAAKFLEFFTDEHPNWAHLDIAGTAFGDNVLHKTKSATGFGVSLMHHFMENLIQNQ